VLQKKYDTYLEYYAIYIRPAISELDIAIKCKTKLSNKRLAEILGSSEAEIERIREAHALKSLDQKAIIKIMQECNSEICQIFRRELETGSPFTYSLAQFAYIYDFDIDLVKAVCAELDISEITWQNMAEVFGVLPYSSS